MTPLKTRVKRLLIIAVLLIFPGKFYSQGDDANNTAKENPASVITIYDDIISFSEQYLGTPYRRGAAGPNRFDCSGFTSFVFKNFGLALSHGCIHQVNEGTPVSQSDLKKGDLIFFKGRSLKSKRVGHVGIVISNEGDSEITFIHASCRKGVTIDKLDSKYYKARYITGLRVLSENANS
ncbi:MAG: C40 family peptidase [Dysgonamonadaceae bacterium]|jgi:cell wall-associated NlpC family hydrolase|nr:C40 family peptidase [Dysgonamonadaceae bacterium]